MHARTMLLAGLSTLALVPIATPALAQEAGADADDSNIIIVTATKRDAAGENSPTSRSTPATKR